MGFLQPGQLTAPGNLEFHGNGSYTTEDVGTLETDRYGLSTCKSRYKINLSNSNNWTSLPQVYSNHPVWNFLECEHQSMEIKGGFAIATCDYVGLNPNLTLTPQYELVIGLSSHSITTHPNFVSKIAGTATAPLNGARFIGYDNSGNQIAIYNANNPATSNQNTLFALFEMFNADGSQNPFAGIDEFLSAAEVTWRSSTTIVLSEGLTLGTAGQIATPQGPIPSIPTGYTAYNWLDMGINGTQRGSAFSLNHEWKLSGPFGYNPVIYTASGP